MRKLIIILSSFLSFLFIGCSQGDIIESDYTINSGSSFGMCVENCYQELSINENKAVLKVRKIRGDDELKKYKRSVTAQEWNDIKALIDQESFNVLPEVIGCPDCADGGAEWIEIKSFGFVKRVTFEYGQPPAQIEELVTKLRETREDLNPDNN